MGKVKSISFAPAFANAAAGRLWCLLFAVCMFSCSGISLNQSIDVGENDWVMAGGGPEQHNISFSELEPPLKLMWTYNVDAGFGNTVIAASDAIVFVNNLQGEMYALDVSTGGKVGQINFLGRDASTTPLIDRKNVIVTYAGDKDNSIASYDLTKGEIEWRAWLGHVQTSPVLKDGSIYVGSLNGKFYKLDRSGGGIKWEFNAGSSIHSTCIVWEDKAVFGTDKGGVFCLGINNGSKQWNCITDGPVMAAPLAFSGMVFFGSYDSNYYCLNIDDGSLKWKKNLKTKLFSGSALYHDSSVVFGGIDGNLYCLGIDDGELKWTFGTYGVISSAPLVSGNYVYFTSFDSFLYCIDGNSGREVWKYELDGKGKTSPVIWKEFLFTAADKYVYCFKKEK